MPRSRNGRGRATGVPLFAERLFIGRNPDKSAIVNLRDPNGRPRLRMLVDSLGAPRIEFLDAAGHATYTVAEPNAKR